MVKKLLKHNYFLIGATICGLFVLLAILGYSITLDATPQANRLMPEWSQLPPTSRKTALRMKREAPKKWDFWLWGDEGSGELLRIWGIPRFLFTKKQIYR